MKNRLSKLLFVGVLGLLLYSCNNTGLEELEGVGVAVETEDSNFKSGEVISFCNQATEVDFLAGQNIKAGTILIGNDNDFVYVIYQTANGWYFSQTQLYVGVKEGVPVNKQGNPQIGLFPLKTVHSPLASYFVYKIRKSDLPEAFIVAAHADVQKVIDGVVVQKETAWSQGTRFVSKGNWAMYTDYEIQNCCEIVPEEFDFLGGQTILAGKLSVTNDSEYLYVTFTTSGNWYLNATHLYVGTLSGLPVNRSSVPVPGSFPYKVTYPQLVNSYTYQIPLSGLPECLIIAAHGELRQVVNGTVVSEETGWSFGTPFPGSNRWGWYSSYCLQAPCN